jgi:tRNA dimethylallyltransferase
VPVTTCQPTEAERRRVRHHLVGILAAEETMTAARFGTLAREAALDIAARGKRALLVGGTGLYLRAALEGLVPAPSADAALRAELVAQAEREGRPALHARLAAIDPESAARLNPNDLTRVVRALEVHALTGKTQTALHRSHRREAPQVRWLALEVPREQLYARIAERTQAIFPGTLAEARALEARGLAAAPAARALGIAEALGHLRGQHSGEEAIAATVQTTRRYAKRQLTWFRKVAGIRWLPEEALDVPALARELAPRP